jgi:hypothetical protein
VAEGTRLLSEYGDQYSIAGSNPALSVGVWGRATQGTRLGLVLVINLAMVAAPAARRAAGAFPGRAGRRANSSFLLLVTLAATAEAARRLSSGAHSLHGVRVGRR